MDTNAIVKSILKSIEDEYHLEKNTYINLIQKNLQVMEKRSGEWFGGSVPEDFNTHLDAMRSAVYKYLEENNNFEDLIHDITLEKIEPVTIIRHVMEQYGQMWGMHSVDIPDDENVIVKSSERVFRDSISQLFLVLSQFWNDDSSCSVLIQSDASNVHIRFRVKNIEEEALETRKLSSVLFSIHNGEEYQFRLGLLTPLESLRNTGAMVKVAADKNRNELVLSISYPSIEFLDTIDSVRDNANKERSGDTGKKTGNLFIEIDDMIIAMVMLEELRDMGYDVRDIPRDAGVKAEEIVEARAYIVEYTRIVEKYGSIGRFKRNIPANLRIVLIYGSEDELIIDCDCKNIYFLKKPFDVDDVRVLVEGFLPSPR